MKDSDNLGGISKQKTQTKGNKMEKEIKVYGYGKSQLACLLVSAFSLGFGVFALMASKEINALFFILLTLLILNTMFFVGSLMKPVMEITGTIKEQDSLEKSSSQDCLGE